MSLPCLVGVEDGGFEAFKPGQSTLLCAACVVGDHVEWVRLGRVAVDGREVTDVLLRLLEGAEFDVLILGGASFAGFNVIDAYRIHDELGVPVIVYSGEEPDSRSTLVALKAHFPDWAERWAPIERLGDVYSMVSKTGEPPVFYEKVGCTNEYAEDMLRASVSLTRTPEPIRVAGIIARGLTRSA
ncbi:MAG: DUF99 family protein [Candidatus Bathyarchaeota archaeon]|nr:DUF99 family protein [Candidatus Bathyarchaeota archaeon]